MLLLKTPPLHVMVASFRKTVVQLFLKEIKSQKGDSFRDVKITQSMFVYFSGSTWNL